MDRDKGEIKVHRMLGIFTGGWILKSKGIGELGISGAGAAIANAVYNAAGVRIRDFPLTLDKVLAGMERA